MGDRFQEHIEPGSNFRDVSFVRCPHCGGCANVRQMEAEVARPSVSRPVNSERLSLPRPVTVFARIICPGCGHSRDLGLNGRSLETATDPCLKLPLWFQTPCCGETLWAYNRPHLAYLKRYVEAGLREEGAAGRRGLASRLPKWMKLAKNRDEVLKCLQKLMRT